MRDHGMGRIVFSSSCATYGNPDRLANYRASPQRPISPYGASTLMVERMLADFGPAHGRRNIALGFFDAVGTDPDSEIGEDQVPETHFVLPVLDAASGQPVIDGNRDGSVDALAYGTVGALVNLLDRQDGHADVICAALSNRALKHDLSHARFSNSNLNARVNEIDRTRC